MKKQNKCPECEREGTLLQFTAMSKVIRTIVKCQVCGWHGLIKRKEDAPSV